MGRAGRLTLLVASSLSAGSLAIELVDEARFANGVPSPSAALSCTAAWNWR